MFCSIKADRRLVNCYYVGVFFDVPGCLPDLLHVIIDKKVWLL